MPAITGPRFLSPMEIRDTSTAQEAPLGSLVETLDGRAFRYMEVGATALVRGNLLQGPANTSGHTDRVVGDAAAVGDMFVTFDSATNSGTADQYAGGYLVVNDAAGEGICYHIGGHATWTASETSVRINLTEPVEIALTADTSEISLHSLWRNVIQHPTAATNIVVGVSDGVPAINAFFFAQVRGVGSVLQEATAAVSVISGGLVHSDTTAGAVEITAQAITAEQEIGRALIVSVDEEHNGVYLTIN